jgi:protein phosphatase
MRQITEDHSYVGYLLRTGQISEREARNHPGRNRLQKALGAEQQYVEPQISVVRLHPGDRLLLCSDGIVDGLWDRAIEEAMRTETNATELVQQAMEGGSRDNLTAIMVRVE